MDVEVPELCRSDQTIQEWTMSKHTFSDLSHVSPVVFLYLLKECYSRGTCKPLTKFRALQHQVHLVLNNAPQPGPAIFVARCLNVLPIFESHCEGFSHLIISALNRFWKIGTTEEDLLKAKFLAAQLFLDIVGGTLVHDERILIKIVETFDISLINIAEVMCSSCVKNDNMSKTFVEQYVFDLIESQSYTTAVALIEHFSIRVSGDTLLLKMMESKDYRAAEKWAAFMGQPMLRLLVKEYVDRNLLKYAYEVIKKNNLQQEFPEVHLKCKESKLKWLAEKGCWDVAEARTNNDRQLLDYLVYLAMEAGYTEKVDELCDRYSLKGFKNTIEPEANFVPSNYLNLSELVIEDVIWVDEVNGLHSATSKIEECKILGVDCEWKPTYEKGAKPNKVSIMQIASEKTVFIFDLIKLFEDVPDILDNCLTRILHSPGILKLGYSFQCDVKQLARSYGKLECFKRYEMLLDIQNLFKEPQGGLSGLAKKILGAGLNKTRRNSNWEKRPLSKNQLEYAALDAVVLVRIFQHVSSHSKHVGASYGNIEWKSYIVSHMDNQRKSKRKSKEKKKTNAMTQKLLP